MKKLFFALLLLLTLPIFGQTYISKVTTQPKTYESNGVLVIDVAFKLDSLSTGVNDSGAVITDPFVLTSIEKEKNRNYNVDLYNYPLTFHVYRNQSAAGLDVKLYAYKWASGDTSAVADTLQIVTGTGTTSTDTVGVLKFDRGIRAEKYFLKIRPYNIGGRRITDGKIRLVATKSEPLK